MRDKQKSGFMYIDTKMEQEQQITAPSPGQVIRKHDRKPPYLVVDRFIEKIILCHFPGKLWQVEVLDPITNDEVDQFSRIRSDAHYVRAVAVKLIEELPLAMLFGQNGNKVCQILHNADKMTYANAQQLAMLRSDMADDYYSAAWNAWLRTVSPKSIHYDQQHANVLSINGSPINHGLSLLSSIIYKRIETVCGDEGFTLIEDEDGDFEPVTVYPWNMATLAMLDAAMAYGSPELLNKQQFEVLTRSYDLVFGNQIED